MKLLSLPFIFILVVLTYLHNKLVNNRFNIPDNDDRFNTSSNNNGFDTPDNNNIFGTPDDDDGMYFIILAYLYKKIFEKNS
ncbi:unnamed protein product [Rhizophagus irregularis]|nr:unnamed protein product [Rhizophagus irregularis]